jgi:hypothetical protein
MLRHTKVDKSIKFKKRCLQIRMKLDANLLWKISSNQILVLLFRYIYTSKTIMQFWKKNYQSLGYYFASFFIISRIWTLFSNLQKKND